MSTFPPERKLIEGEWTWFYNRGEWACRVYSVYGVTGDRLNYSCQVWGVGLRERGQVHDGTPMSLDFNGGHPGPRITLDEFSAIPNIPIAERWSYHEFLERVAREWSGGK